jgi:hypothetical protein
MSTEEVQAILGGPKGNYGTFPAEPSFPRPAGDTLWWDDETFIHILLTPKGQVAWVDYGYVGEPPRSIEDRSDRRTEGGQKEWHLHSP